MDSLSLFKRQNDGVSINSGRKNGGGDQKQQRELTKLLVNVNIQNSLGTIHVVMSPENTVEELVEAAIGIYVKEKRRPLLGSNNPLCYELHYSQFNLECLKREEKLVDLSSRNFFLCPKSSS
ncbi:hypothetical protein ACJIZ3_004070 [Penstemon smallii]|uniref:DUF7054 domain-containing protein n=1 Tax=Penstemon smallii TaxID=265156 RepID=A0ABD3S136_9LAMI